ncbi:MAG: response regulator [Gammaproteobacteria bacterium]
MIQRPPSILLVEDDDVEAEAVRRGLERHGVGVSLERAADGREALELLRQARQHPLLVLLDLNLPVMSGLEFLRALRADSALRQLVVFVLSTSAAPGDRESSYGLGIAGYINKDDVGRDHAAVAELVRAYQLAVTPP